MAAAETLPMPDTPPSGSPQAGPAGDGAHPARAYTPEPDAATRLAFHRGEALAFAEMAERFMDDIARFAASMLGPDALADAAPGCWSDAVMEVVQETFLRALERHALYDPARAFRPWLFAVCRRTAATWRRQQHRDAARVIELDPSDDDVVRLASTTPSPLEAWLAAESIDAVMEALTRLPETTRAVICLHLWDGLTFREIADVLQRPANTLATMYYRALKELRDQLSTDRPRPTPIKPSNPPGARRS